MRTSSSDLLDRYQTASAHKARCCLVRLFIVLLLILRFAQASANGQTAMPMLSYVLSEDMPRAAHHFTQGLVYDDEVLYESTGKYGQSALFIYDKKDLSLRHSLSLDKDQFAEGITVLKDKLYQLEWRSGLLHVYSLSLKPLHTLPIASEGWGLTTDGEQLILSDGTDTLFFLDPRTAATVKTIHVQDAHGKHWDNLNELEWVNGVLLANVWHQDAVLAIDPITGIVIGQYDFSPLSQRASRAMPFRDGEQVLNGLACDSTTQTLLVTGKDWPRWFRITLTPTPSSLPHTLLQQGSP